MKKYISIIMLAGVALMAACEKSETTTVNPPAENKTENTTVVKEPENATKTESTTTTKTDGDSTKTKTTTTSSPNP